MLLDTLNAALHSLEVFQLQFSVNNLFVSHGVNGAVYMNDVGIVKTAENVDDGVALADIAEELVAKTLALRGTFD